ncbi:MAG: aldolase catalytic domain-containing protein [Armatimonadetes bacterium]|nr:aldolase catalytic domain-containing protein [Armatimonadota bacterium]
MASNASKSGGDWVGYREEIQVLDCTIRDGGLMNDHRFEDAVVKAVYDANVAAGVDYMEMGYKASQRIFAPDSAGGWKFCREADVRRIVGDNPTSMKLSAMCDAERTDYHEDVLPCEQSVFDMVRVATYIHQIPTAIDMIQDAHQKGYATTVNLMAVSTVPEYELDRALEQLAHTDVGAIYLVDSFGSLYSEQVQYLVGKYLSFAQPAGKQVGVHFHNNLQLGFANTIEGIVRGANRLDATFAGLGRGAGNCQMELLLAFLHNPKFDLRPVLRCVQDHIEPLRKTLKWGFGLSYLITGMLNQHPRAAIKYGEADEPGDIVEFYESVIEQA